MNETLKGLYAGLVVNLLVLALAGNTFWEPSKQAWLVTFGAANELLGVFLVASPELLPRVQGMLAFAGRHARASIQRFGRLLSRLLRLPGRTIVMTGTAHGRATMSGEGRVIRGFPHNATTEQLLAALIERYKELEDRTYELEKEVRGLPQRWRDEIAATRYELEGATQELVRSTADRNLRLRLLGLLYVVVGIILAWLGNVV